MNSISIEALRVKSPFDFQALRVGFVQFSKRINSDHVTVSNSMMKSFLFVHPRSLSLLLSFVLFCFLTFGHGTKFNSKEAETSNKIELSSLPVFLHI